MKQNMNQWIEAILDSSVKPALPLLSQPASQLLGINSAELLYNSSLRAQGMKQIAEYAPMPAVFDLMDLALEAECFGAKAHLSKDGLPVISAPLICSREDAELLEIPEVGSGRSRIALETASKALTFITDRPVFSCITGPFTLAGCLMGISEIMLFCLDDPDMVDVVLEKASAFLINYCLALKNLGVHGILLAEPLAGLISPLFAEKFSARYVKLIVHSLQDENFIFIYHNCGNFSLKQIDSILSIGARVLHFGNSIKMEQMLTYIPDTIPVLGNLDPVSQFRNGSPASVYQKTMLLLKACANRKNFLPSSGCDIPSSASWENIDAFFQAVSDYYSSFPASLQSFGSF